jgi:hypothetical protein
MEKDPEEELKHLKEKIKESDDVWRKVLGDNWREKLAYKSPKESGESKSVEALLRNLLDREGDTEKVSQNPLEELKDAEDSQLSTEEYIAKAKVKLAESKAKIFLYKEKDAIQ